MAPDPRSHGETYHENLNIDLNFASQEELERLPMVGKERAKLIVENRPLRIGMISGRFLVFRRVMIDDLERRALSWATPKYAIGLA